MKFNPADRKVDKGIRLDCSEPHWELDGPDSFAEMFTALRGWVPPGAYLYFEGGSPDEEIKHFLKANAVDEPLQIARGTIWPPPRIDHLPASGHILRELARLMERHAEPELAVHFHIHQNGRVLLEWHDAFFQPMLISGQVHEVKARVLADRLGKTLTLIERR